MVMVFNFTFNNITVILWNINRYNCVTIMKTKSQTTNKDSSLLYKHL